MYSQTLAYFQLLFPSFRTFCDKGNPLKIKFTRDKKGQNESSMSYLYKGFSRKLEILGGFGEIGLETNAKTSFILNK